jgi:hypothetical protein
MPTKCAQVEPKWASVSPWRAAHVAAMLLHDLGGGGGGGGGGGRGVTACPTTPLGVMQAGPHTHVFSRRQLECV